MSDYLIWLIVALVILGCEMMLGTIYLLAFSAGALAACISALFGLSLTSQFSIAAIVVVLGVVIALYFRKNLRKLTPNTQCDNLDKGQIVNVTSVNEDGSAKVNYRGTTWTAYADNGSLECGVYKIDRVEGTRLIIKK